MADDSPGGAAPPTPVTPAPVELTAGVATDVMPGTVLPVAGRKTGWRRWLPIAGVVSFLLAGAIGMLLFLGVNIGPTGLAIGITAAVLPVPLLVAAFLWLDRYEPEPIRYLAFCFAWGAAIATAVALLVNTGSALLFEKIGLPDALVAVLVAPFIEESMKAAGPLLLFWRRRAEWSGITDGIVYCGLSALGFAMVENVLYLGEHGYAAGVEQYGPATGLQNLFAIFIVRILFTGFAHPLFSSMTGIGLGIAARSGDRKVRWLAPIAGLLLAMILHGTFNLLPTLSVSLSQPLIMLYGYLGFMVPFFFAVVGFAIALRAWEGRLTERILPYYVSTGWFSPPEVAALGSLGRRYSARQWARRVSGETGQKAMRSFQFASTQLALLRDGMNRGLDRKPRDIQRAATEEQRLLSEILEYRAVFTAKDPQAPQAFWDGHNYQIAFPDGVTRTVPPPTEPVVPLPVRVPPPTYAFSAQPQPFSAVPAAPYSAPPGYGPYGAQPGGPYGPPPSAPSWPQPAYGPPPGYAQPGHPQPGYAQPGYPQPGYPQPGYSQSGYGQTSYGQPGYPSPGYSEPGYGQAAYGSQPGYTGQPSDGGQHGYASQPGHGQPTYGSQPGYDQPTYGSQPGYAGQPSGEGQHGHASQPGHGQPAYGSQPGHGQPAYGSQPGYSGQPSDGGQPGYGQPTYGSQPGYAGQHPGAGNAVHGSQPRYGEQPGYNGQPALGAQSTPGTWSNPETPSDNSGQPGHGNQPPVTPGTTLPPGYGTQPTIGAQPGQGAQPSHGEQPGRQPEPSYTYPADQPATGGYPTPPPFAPPPSETSAAGSPETRPDNESPAQQ